MVKMERASASLWRRINERYNLVGNKCENCGKVYFPKRIVCRQCGRKTKMREEKLSGNGKVYAVTKIRVPAQAFKDSAPYTVAVVELEEGPRVEGHVVDAGNGEVKIGTKVHSVFRKMHADGEEGLIYYHFKFEPV